MTRGRVLLRVALASVAVLDASIMVRLIRAAAADAARRGAGPPLLAVASPAVLAVAFAVVVGAAVVFARGRASIASAAIALVTLAGLEHALSGLTGIGHQRVFFTGGATLAGWLVGLVFARPLRDTDRPDRADFDEQLAEFGALAGLAATYVDAGLSKLTTGGLGWADAMTLRGAVLSNHAVDDTSPLAAYARLVVESDGIARAFAAATLVVQLGAVALVVGPRARVCWGVLLLAFHLNVFLLTGIMYAQACILVAAFAFPWHRLGRREAPAHVEPPAPERTRAAGLRAAQWVVAAVATAWLVRLMRG